MAARRNQPRTKPEKTATKHAGREKAGPARHAKQPTGANVGYEAQLWQMADALRGSMDAAEQTKGADPEDPGEDRAKRIFWVPAEGALMPLAGGVCMLDPRVR